MQVIDAHQHLWSMGSAWHGWPPSGLAPIARDFGPEDLLPLLERHGIEGTILVQSQPSDADTEWLLEIAARTPEVLGVVGWIDLLAPEASARVAALADRPKLKGLRPMLQDLAPDWITQPAAGSGLSTMAERGLVFNALVRPVHLGPIIELALRHPELTMVVDHAAKPAIAEGTRQPWADDIGRLAKLSNVCCKLSGLITEAQSGWTADDLAFYAAHVLDRFGPDRVMWGSDWPVVLLRDSYEGWLDTARGLVPPGQHSAVFGGNAARTYRLTRREA